MNIHLILRRFAQVNDATPGDLYIDGVYECHTLEDQVREPGVKVPGKTAIPAGTYRVILSLSQRFKRVLPLLCDVPGFTGVRIHAGNTTADTEGCILVGREVLGDTIRQSRAALGGLMEVLLEAQEQGEVISMEVRNDFT